MHYELLYQPAFAVARITLQPGESIRAESGAMIGMSPNVEISSKLPGGIGKAIGRVLGGESIFQTTFTAHNSIGEVLLAPATPGDILPINPGAGLVVTSGCYLAGQTHLEMKTVASMKGFFAGEGLFMMQLIGDGLALLSSFGAIHAVNLEPGQQYVVDTGNLVAFTLGMNYAVRAAQKSLLGSFTSGEGYVVNLTGPGQIYIQTRTLNLGGSGGNGVNLLNLFN